MEADSTNLSAVRLTTIGEALSAVGFLAGLFYLLSFGVTLDQGSGALLLATVILMGAIGVLFGPICFFVGLCSLLKQGSEEADSVVF